ncbi:MAG: gliding motility-associated ABC transporter ATP-binding subunit GldA [Putridiphycobacter sp.]|nr:gliding motility-associated ABC transporter ATP-binding subunit GldA [Putridiphycobacter sp.]
MSIEVKNVSKYYGEQAALNGVSFEIKSGEIVGFLGPNGAGKSTMMKIITCFLTASSGTVKVCGLDVETDAIEVRRKVGYLPEHNPLYLDMYVKEYLAFVAGIYNKDAVAGTKLSIKERVAEMVKLVGLTKEQNKKIGALSKGYRQRVGLAQAMIHNPEVLILDEPTSGLDPNQLVEIRQLIQEIGKTKTVMLSTHVMQEVEAICDRVIIIKEGNIVANDTKSKIHQIQGESQVVFVEFDQEMKRTQLKQIDGVKTVKNIAGNQWLFAAKTGVDIRSAIAKFAQTQNVLILTIRVEEQSIEDVFKALTN